MPRPICFMIMPYRRKPSHAEPGRGPTTVDFDALWTRALLPLLEEDLGYDAVRADQDVGALIIHEMIERLTLADLIVADVSTPNGNVYYEVGVRHAARESGCVLVSADWARPLFDLEQMRVARYPLPEGEITEATAAGVRAALRDPIRSLARGRSPVFAIVPGYPDRTSPATASAFRAQMEALSEFTSAVRTVRLTPEEQRGALALALRDEYRDAARALPSVAFEIVGLLRDCADWRATAQFIDSLPEQIRSLPAMKEQHCLAQSSNGDHVAAIAALEELIRTSGESSERRGLLGGRYKKLYAQEQSPLRKARHLDQAIDQYERGMRHDLNDYYPASNLPRLLRRRGRPDDEARAQAAAAVTVLACERALARNPDDPWIRPTLLGAAFDAGDVATARRLGDEIRLSGADAFKLEATIPDLETAIQLLADPARAAELRVILDDLRPLLPPPALPA